MPFCLLYGFKGRIKHCSKECRAEDRRLASIAHANRRYALKKGAAFVEKIDRVKVFERDKWRCYLCGLATPRKLLGTYDPKAPTLDHVISLAKGGWETYSNLRCAHRLCNMRKQDGAGVLKTGQVMLL